MGVTITPEMLKAMSRKHKPELCDALAPALTELLPTYGIDTPLRVAHFLAQAAHETDGWRTLVEYASGAAYEGRLDLGNREPGDGRKFKGRGIFQCTGRANYAHYGAKLGLPLTEKPELAADPTVSVKIAALYWNDRRMSRKADADDILGASIAVNGRNRKTGLPNGFEDRKAMLAAAKRVLGLLGERI
jgi:putative chitinase